jgi:hypothetical protein
MNTTIYQVWPLSKDDPKDVALALLLGWRRTNMVAFARWTREITDADRARGRAFHLIYEDTASDVVSWETTDRAYPKE